MADNDKIQRLKELIAIELDNCKKEDWPYVCHMKLSAEGRKSIEDMVIEQCSASGCSVGVALDRIERSYNPNRIEE